MGTKSKTTGASIFRNKVRIWFKYEGKPVYEFTGHRPTPSGLIDAARLRAEIVQKIDMGLFTYRDYFPNSIRANQDTGSFFVMAKKYIATMEQHKAASTVKGYRKMINNYWLPLFMERPIGTITTGDIHDAITDSGLTDLSNKTFNNAMTPLRGIFDLAVDYESISINPCNKIKAAKLQRPMPDPMDESEMYLMLRHIAPEWLNYFRVAFGTGMRPSELIALRWADVDFNSGLIRVERAYVEKQVKGTKTYKPRFVELNELSISGLRDQKASTYLAGVLVFEHRGKQINNDKPPRNAWNAALKKAEIRHRVAYCTRHTFISIALSGGANPFQVSEQAGHSMEMMLKHYTKWMRQADSGISGMFSTTAKSKRDRS